MTTTITPDDAGLVRTSTADVRPDAVDDLVVHLSGACDALAGGGGLLASTVLVSQAAPDADPVVPVRVVHLTRWATAEHLDAASAALALPSSLKEALAGRTEHDLDLRLLHTTRPEQRTELAAGGPATFLVTMDADPSSHEELVELNARDTEQVFSGMPGFVGCTLFGDHRHERVFEIVQWESMPHFFAAISTPAFAEHNTFLQGVCHTTDARPYRVVHTARGA